jgi:hypothetical protein
VVFITDDDNLSGFRDAKDSNTLVNGISCNQKVIRTDRQTSPIRALDELMIGQDPQHRRTQKQVLLKGHPAWKRETRNVSGNPNTRRQH